MFFLKICTSPFSVSGVVFFCVEGGGGTFPSEALEIPDI